MKLWYRSCLLFILVLSRPLMGQALAEKDLALVLDRDPAQAIRFQNAGAGILFPQSWYQAVLNGFRQTPVGDALERENVYDHWQLTGIRVAPCMPIGLVPTDNVREHCWPEVRLVWQPIVRTTTGGLFADDRAIHATYDVFPTDALSQEELSRVIALRNRLFSYYWGFKDPNNLLNAQEEAEFRALRNKVVQRLIGNTIWLRTLNASYAGHGLRPEYGRPEFALFRSRLLTWLQAYAPAHLIKEATAFSLPAGRAPGAINGWSFIAFHGQSGQLQPRNLSILSTRDGTEIFNFGDHSSASRQQDDPRLLRTPVSAAIAQELRNSVIFNAVDRNRLLPRLADRNQILPNNTSCASCHRFNQDGNDFHNMSYFVGLPQISLAERVRRDVAWDLNWLATHLQ
ncbi:hypothetical protein [Oligoflexus tunisiensis]|uniref:hypothetical protein n=1 Tax=Oligoflexus tunisiensis TaxID=708132 RepID=UPI00114D37C8|nr:hypothetical protein [Oligoflexus tunisiensis]